jgi:hypothetical protein
MESRSPVILVVASVILISFVQCKETKPKDGVKETQVPNLKVIEKTSLAEVRVEVTLTHPIKYELNCFQCKYNSTVGAVLTYIYYEHYINYTQNFHNFKLKLQREGYLHCKYRYALSNFIMKEITSKTVYFYLENKHVSVVKLKQESSVKHLQDKIGHGKFTVLWFSNQKTLFHLTTENSTKNEDILEEVRNLLKTNSLAVEYVRSTVACPPNEKYKLPSTDLPFNVSLATHNEKYCVGNFYTGVYWHEKELQKREEEVLRLQRVIKLNYSALDNNDAIQDFSSTLVSLSYLKSQEVKTVANNFNLLLFADKNIWNEDEQKTSNSLLAKLETLLGNISLVSEEEKVQVEQENFAVRVEDIKKTGTTGVLVSDIASIGESSRLKMESLNQSHGIGNMLYTLPRFVELIKALKNTQHKLSVIFLVSIFYNNKTWCK